MQRKIIIAITLLLVLCLVLITLSILPLLITPANQWSIQETQIDKLHQLGFYGSGITIGIIDTGIDSNHHEFDQTSFLGWNDFIHHQDTYYDDEDQGTHIAGILISQGSYHGLVSGINLKGIAHKAELFIVKAIPKNHYLFGGGNDSIIADAIQFCIDNNVDIILLSLGMSPDYIDFSTNTKTTEKINQAIQQGIFIVAPAGNDQHHDDGDVCFPSTIPNVISVGAIKQTNTITSFTSKGHQYPWSINPNKKPELVAPGEKIMSTRTNGAYGQLSGTPQAAAFVCGILALLLEAYPEYKPNGAKNQNQTTIQLFKEIFAITAKKIGTLQNTPAPYSHNDYYGYGLIQAYEAYKELAKY
ncbi:MAG: S8 family serine peptidase [Thermoplasmatota archaeon]